MGPRKDGRATPLRTTRWRSSCQTLSAHGKRALFETVQKRKKKSLLLRRRRQVDLYAVGCVRFLCCLAIQFGDLELACRMLVKNPQRSSRKSATSSESRCTSTASCVLLPLSELTATGCGCGAGGP